MTCTGHLELLSAPCPLTSDTALQKVLPIASGQCTPAGAQGGSLKRTLMS